MDNTPVEIKVRDDGPLKVTGPVRVVDADGRAFPLPERADRPLPLRALADQAVLRRLAPGHRLSLLRARRTVSPGRGPGTRVVRAGLPEAADGEPLLPGPTFAAPFHLAGEISASPYGYGRSANPTWTRLETALGELEGGEAVVFASGMAAVSAVVLGSLGPGDVLVAPGDGYPGVRWLSAEHLDARGIEVRLVASDESAFAAAIPGATLVWVETPSNPGLARLDVAALARAAHDAGAAIAVDGTLAGPLAQRPLELGADLSMTSASKQLTGHADLVLGYVAARAPERVAALRRWRTITGAVPGPFEAWLAHRSLATLAVRAERQAANAEALAALLRARDDVEGSAGPASGRSWASTRAPRPARRPSSPPPSSSTRPRASAACTRPASVARAGGRTPCRRATSGSAPGSRTRPTSSATSGAPSTSADA